jgi:VanZ family protein
MLSHWHLPTIIWGLIIVILTLTPFGDKSSPDIPLADKVVHLGLFGIFTLLLVRSFLSNLKFKNILLLIAFLFAASFGLFVELLQNIVPGRNFEWMDWLADMIGSGIGIAAFKILNMNNWRVFK